MSQESEGSWSPVRESSGSEQQNVDSRTGSGKDVKSSDLSRVITLVASSDHDLKPSFPNSQLSHRCCGTNAITHSVPSPAVANLSLVAKLSLWGMKDKNQRDGKVGTYY